MPSNKPTTASSEKDDELKNILISFRIGDIDIHMARFKISKLFNNELTVKQNIATEEWDDV